MNARKRPVPPGPEGEESAKGTPAQKKAKPLDAKFGGMTEEEVCKLLLPDHMGPGLDIIFVSTLLIREEMRWF